MEPVNFRNDVLPAGVDTRPRVPYDSAKSPSSTYIYRTIRFSRFLDVYKKNSTMSECDIKNVRKICQKNDVSSFAMR